MGWVVGERAHETKRARTPSLSGAKSERGDEHPEVFLELRFGRISSEDEQLSVQRLRSRISFLVVLWEGTREET